MGSGHPAGPGLRLPVVGEIWGPSQGLRQWPCTSGYGATVPQVPPAPRMHTSSLGRLAEPPTSHWVVSSKALLFPACCSANPHDSHTLSLIPAEWFCRPTRGWHTGPRGSRVLHLDREHPCDLRARQGRAPDRGSGRLPIWELSLCPSPTLRALGSRLVPSPGAPGS